tara:strand:+ start:563 stop:793 length:231 start_codon:yes stop_codon:yes gene_type:complete
MIVWMALRVFSWTLWATLLFLALLLPPMERKICVTIVIVFNLVRIYVGQSTFVSRLLSLCTLAIGIVLCIWRLTES